MSRPRLLLAGVGSLLLALLPTAASAQEGPGILPGRALAFLLAAFLAVWALFFAYLFYLLRRASDLRREVDALERAQRERASSEEKRT